MDVEELIRLIAAHLEVHPSEIAPGARFIEDLDASHMALAALFIAIEERFDLRIPMQEAVRLTTLLAVIRYLDARQHSM